MRCEDVRPLISAGLDGELDTGRAAQVEAHLGDCAACAAERESLSATVRLLRALPESAPPVELRRRIGVALLEEQRRVERRWLGLPWLARPQAAAWAWGAAAGAVIAVTGLIATRGPASAPPIVSRPPAVREPVGPPAVAPGWAVVASAVKPKPEPKKKTAPPSKSSPERESPEARAAATGPQVVATAGPALPKPGALKREALRPAPRRAVRAEEREAPVRSRRPAPSSVPRHTPAPGRPESSGRDAPFIAQGDPMPSTPAPPPTGSMDEGGSGTSGMTQMASTVPPMETPSDSSDDLVELRRRLIGRPLQVPDLGELRPADGNRSSREGWIRF